MRDLEQAAREISLYRIDCSGWRPWERRISIHLVSIRHCYREFISLWKATCQDYARRFIQVPKDAVAFPSIGCKIVHIVLGKADLCTTRCEAAKGRWQSRDKQITKAYVDGNVLVTSRSKVSVWSYSPIALNNIYEVVVPIWLNRRTSVHSKRFV